MRDGCHAFRGTHRLCRPTCIIGDPPPHSRLAASRGEAAQVAQRTNFPAGEGGVRGAVPRAAGSRGGAARSITDIGPDMRGRHYQWAPMAPG